MMTIFKQRSSKVFIFYPVVWLIQTFGLEPETFSFWIGALLVNLYVLFLAIAFTAVVGVSIVMGFHMIGSILTWF